jgi:hypothetical protein
MGCFNAFHFRALHGQRSDLAFEWKLWGNMEIGDMGKVTDRRALGQRAKAREQNHRQKLAWQMLWRYGVHGVHNYEAWPIAVLLS